MNRRQFIASSGAAAASLYLTARAIGKRSPNDKLNLGVIGTANRAGEDLRQVSTENIVALCDIDSRLLAAAKASHPDAKTYTDFRKLLERKDLDAIVVGTPDHTHAVAAVAALESGRHLYCEKPLAHTVSEARRITEVARRKGLVTQLGTQIHATNNYRQVVDLIQKGTIGDVREVHVWVDVDYPAPTFPPPRAPVPANLNWDLWVGPVESRPYSPQYVPKHWRRWWTFGGGVMSDFGCHYMDLPHWALGLRHPISIEAEGPPVHPETTPPWTIVRYQYPGVGEAPPVKLTWYHGKRDGREVRPPHFERGELPKWGNGVLFVGAKGMLLSEYWKYLLLPEKDFPAPAQPGQRTDNDYEREHHQEWINAIKNGGKTSCNFDYSGPLSEAVLLGNVAYRTGEKIQWDAAQLKAPGNPLAEQYIQHHYRPGWKI